MNTTIERFQCPLLCMEKPGRIGNPVKIRNGTATVCAEAACWTKVSQWGIFSEKAARKAEDAQVRRPAGKREKLSVPSSEQGAVIFVQKNGCSNFLRLLQPFLFDFTTFSEGFKII